MHRPSPNTVTGPVAPVPAHAARPAPPRTGRLAALGAGLLVAIGLGMVAQQGAGGPEHSTPPSAQFMTDDSTGSQPGHR